MISTKLKLELARAVSQGEVRFDEPMADHTTFRIGGPVECMVIPHTEEEVRSVVALCRLRETRVRIMGRGSNILVCDEGLSGVVVCMTDAFAHISVDGSNVYAQAGASNDRLAQVVCEAGLGGYEFASGIPGSVGGAAIMNAGAYGGEFRDVATSVRCLTPQGTLEEVRAEDMAWSYRSSMMKDKDYVILGVRLSLAFDEVAAIRERMDSFAQMRCQKQPLDVPSAGSTFKRPVGYFAGKLIEDAGLRGYSVGGAQVCEKHCGFIVNAHNASASEVRQVIFDVQKRVLENSGVHLEPEVAMWGFNE